MNNTKKYQQAFTPQQSQNTCGLACLVSLCKFYGIQANEEDLKKYSGTNLEGTTMLGLKEALQHLGFQAEGYKAEIKDLKQLQSPCIIHIINEHGINHFIIVYQYDPSKKLFTIGDPAQGLAYVDSQSLDRFWDSKFLLTADYNNNHKPAPDKKKKITLYNVLKPDFNYLLIILMISILTSLITLATAVFSQKLVDDILPQKNVSLLTMAVLLYTFIILLSIFLTYLLQQFIITQTRLFNVRLLKEFFQKVFFLPKTFFISMKTGEIISRMSDTERIQTSIINVINSVIIELFAMAFSIAILVYYNWQIALITFFTIPSLSLISIYYSKKINKLQYQVMSEYATFETYSIDIINGIEPIKIHQKEKKFFNKIYRYYKTTQNKRRKLGQVGAKYDLNASLISSFFSVIALFLSSYYVITGRLQIGELFAIITILSSIIASSVKISSFLVSVQESKVAFNRSFDIMNTESEVQHQDTYSNLQPPLPPASLQIKDLTFRYTGKMELLQNLNLVAHKGEFISIFGNIGAGKSTLLYLLEQFYIPQSGTILYNGHEIYKYPLQSWRSILGVASQQTKIFIGTIAQNITMFEENSEEHLKNFLKKYNMDFFLNSGDLHYENMLDEEGGNLSGGQKQLIGIARALYSNPAILLLDEPTASMDKTHENFIMSLLNRAKQDLITIMITHKPELAKKTDKIYVLGNKTFQISGTHYELMATANLYSNAYNSLFT